MLDLLSRACREPTHRSWHWLLGAVICLLTLAPSSLPGYAASEHRGQVNFGGLPVPGATVTATQGDKQFTAITDERGVYVFPNLDDGEWTFRVEMRGFAIETRQVVIDSDAPSPVW